MRKSVVIVIAVLLGVVLCLAYLFDEQDALENLPIISPPSQVADSPHTASESRESPKPATPPVHMLPVVKGVSGSIAGLVLQPDGQPAAGARVSVRWRQSERQPVIEAGWLESDGDHILSTETDCVGHFHIAELRLGWAVVSARHDSGRAVERLHIDARQPRHEIVLVLAGGESLAGVVVDGGARGIGGARVTPLERDGQKQFKYQSEAGAVIADETGGFRVDGLRPGEWTLHVSADGFGPVIAGPFPTGIDSAHVVLGKGTDLDCHVLLLADHAPVAGVTVKLAYADHALYPIEAVSGKDGVARFPALGEGLYQADVGHGRYTLVGDAPRITVGNARRPDPVSLVVAEGGRMRGTVRDGESGEGIPGVVVAAMRAEHPLYYGDPTGGDGTYEIAGLPADDYEVEIRDRVPGYPQESPRPPARRVTVGAEGLLDGVDFELTRGAILAGIVRDVDGHPAAGVMVIARNVEGAQNLATFSTSDDGRFEFGAYAPGEAVQLSAERGMARSGLRGPFEAGGPGSDAIEIVLDRDCAGIIAGIVVDARGNPVECQVSASSSDPELAFPVTTPVGTTDGLGNFVLAGVCPDDYVIGVYKAGSHSQEVQRVRLAAGQRVTGLRLVYDEGELFTLSGFVTDERGNPVENARVQARAIPKPLQIPEQSTGADGAFLFDGLPAGEYMLQARARGLEGDGFLVASAGTSDVVLVLGIQRVLSGRVVDSLGAPVANFSVTVLSEENPDSPVTSDFADPGGHFRIPAPPSGNWMARVEAPGQRPLEVDVPAEALVEGDYEMELVLEPVNQ